MPDVPAMRVLIVDDEEPARARLRHLLRGVPGIAAIDEAEDGEDAVARMVVTPPDVVLLDIQMPRLDGFGVVQALGAEMPLTIICTAFSEHALDAFDARAIDYLLKPVQPDRLGAALERARALLAGPVHARRRGIRAVGELVESRGAQLHRLLVRDAHRALLLPIDCVDLIRADRNYCDIRAGGAVYRVRRTLRSFDGRLDPARFLRMNKSDIVRLDAVREIQPWSHGDYRALLHDGTVVPWSRRYRAAHPG